MPYRTLMILCLGAVACGERKAETAARDSAARDSGAADSSTGERSEYSWYQDVRPLVYDKCTSCHNADGIGTGDFSSYEGTAAASEEIVAWVGDGRMPLATADPACRDYHGAERMHLAEEERALLVDWAAHGAPEGSPEGAPEVEPYDGHLSETNVRLEMPLSRKVEGEAGQSDYFCTVPDNPLGFEYVEAIDVDLGEPRIVHHMCLFADLGLNAGAGYGVDPEQAREEGFACGNPIVENDWVPLHCWAPGMEPVVFPEGVGMAVYPDQYLQLVIQMHYFNPDGGSYEDRSAYELRTTDSVEREVWMDVAGPENLNIPAGSEAHSESAVYPNYYGEEVEILGAFPHMHLLGERYDARLTGGEEEVCLVEGAYDFDHQATYMFTEPVTWGRDDSLSFECVYNNSSSNPDNPSDPPLDVSYGEGTTDEMCYLLFYVAEP